MSDIHDSTITSWFCKSSDSGYAKYSRRFHNLSREAQRIAVSLIKNNMPVDEAIKTAKRSVTV